MATKAPAPPQDDFNLDDIKLDDFPMEDNALFADLDNEMRADGGKGKAGGGDLDLNLDLDSGSGDAMPALEEPGELKIDDTLDLDLSLDDAPKADAAGGGDLDLDLNLDESPAAEAKGGDADLDLNLDLDEAPKTGDADLKLDGDIELNLEEPEATASGSADMDLDVGSLGLNLDEAPAEGGAESLSLEEPTDLNLDMDEPGEPKFDMDLPEEPALSPGVDSDGISLSLAEPETPAATAAEPEMELPPPDEPAAVEPDLELPPLDEPAAPAMVAPAARAAAELDLTLDEGISLDSIPEATTGGGEPEQATEFQAAPDVNIDDIDLSLETGGAEGPTLEPLGAQVDLQSPDMAAPTMEQGFDLPPLAETKGDVEGEAAEDFVAVPDVKLTEDEVLELNLPAPEMHDEQPDFTMAPEPMPGEMPGGMAMAAAAVAGMATSGKGSEFRLTEPMSMGAPVSAGGPGMRMAAPKSGTTMVAPGMGGMAAAPPREAAVSQDILLTIPHKISVQMGQVNLIGKDIRNLAYGSVVQLNRTVGEPVDLLLDGRAIAQGEIVLINGKNLGVRILALNK